MANWSGLWNGRYNANYAGLGTNTTELNGPELQNLARQLRPRGMQKLRELIDELTGVAPGATATVASKRLVYVAQPGVPLVNGGVQTPVTVTVLSRITTAADVTLIKASLNATRAPSTYPVDKSGNGGGGKVNNAF